MENKKNPKISIIIPVYNGAKHLKETIDSILNQSFRDFELIIVDDASTDNSVEIIKSYGDEVRLIEHKVNKGAPAGTKNTGIENSRGELVAFSDHDDIWLPDKLKIQVEIFNNNPRLVASFTNGYIFDDIKQENLAERWSKVEEFPTKESIKNRLLNENFILTTTAAVIKKDVLGKIGKFDEKMKLADDYDLWFRLADFGPINLVAKPLFKWRFHMSSLSNREDRLLEDLLYFYDKVLKTSDLTDEQKEFVSQRIITYKVRLANYYLSEYRYSESKKIYECILKDQNIKAVRFVNTLMNISPSLASFFVSLKRRYSKKASKAHWTLAENL